MFVCLTALAMVLGSAQVAAACDAVAGDSHRPSSEQLVCVVTAPASTSTNTAPQLSLVTVGAPADSSTARPGQASLAAHGALPYSYVNGNPVNAWDPTGHRPDDMTPQQYNQYLNGQEIDWDEGKKKPGKVKSVTSVIKAAASVTWFFGFGVLNQQIGRNARTADNLLDQVGAWFVENADELAEMGQGIAESAAGGAAALAGGAMILGCAAGTAGTGGLALAVTAPCIVGGGALIASGGILMMEGGRRAEDARSRIRSTGGESNGSQSAMGAYDEALTGGKHAGFFRNYLNKPRHQIERGITSLEKQIAEHQAKIQNPSAYVNNWASVDPREQQALLNNKWPGDIARQQEQIDILRGILGSR